ncbi:MAG: hypothetical protein ACTHNW_06485, partial [Mucilaginibacter sp.]
TVETNDLALDYLLFRQLDALKQCLEIADQADRWLAIQPNIELLMRIHEGRVGGLDEDLMNAGLMQALNLSLISRIEDSLLMTRLKNDRSRLLALQSVSNDSDLVSFISYLTSLFPEDTAVRAENHELLAVLVEHAGREAGLKLYQQIQQKDISLENAVSDLLAKEKRNDQPFKTGSIAGEQVLRTLMQQIDTALPAYPDDKRQLFINLLEEVIRYARTTFVNNDKARFKFLFSEREGGKGQTAIEQDLQDSMLVFFEHSRIADGLEHEKAKFVDGGRVDILYKKDIMTIPIELKKTLLKQNKAALEQNYIAQAQTYTAGYDQLGIFVLLDLSDKSADPPANFKDWFNIHHLMPSGSLELKNPDYIVSAIIPGNRTLPSSKSIYQ